MQIERGRNFHGPQRPALLPKIFEHIKPREDFAADVFPRLLEKKLKVCGYVFTDYWLDIGRTTDYEHINQFISVIDLTKGMK